MRRLVVFAALAWAAAFPPAAVAQTGDALPPERFSVDEDQPRTGTHIARPVVHGSRIPLNRTYAQLTADEKRLVKSQYEAMAEGDEPPFPLEGLEPLYRSAHQASERIRYVGAIALVAHVDVKGVVTSVDALRQGDAEVDQRMASVLMLTRFKPAVCGGQPCAMDFPFRLTRSHRL